MERAISVDRDENGMELEWIEMIILVGQHEGRRQVVGWVVTTPTPATPFPGPPGYYCVPPVVIQRRTYSPRWRRPSRKPDQTDARLGSGAE